MTTTTTELLTRAETDILILETAEWHRRAQHAVSHDDPDGAYAAYSMREALARYIAARTTELGFHEIRALAIVVAMSLP